MDLDKAQKAHVVLLPFPEQGHINPFMQLGKLLHSEGFHITFINTKLNQRRLIRSKGPEVIKGLPDFRFETLLEGLPSGSDCKAPKDPQALYEAIRKNCFIPFVELLSKLESNSEVPKVSYIISDGMMSFAIKVAEMFGIPEIQFWTASACGFLGYLQFGEFIKRGIIPFKDENFVVDGTLDIPIDWVPGMNNIRIKDMPSFVRITDIEDILFDFFKSESENCLKASAIIFNTFDEFEHEVLRVISTKFPNIYSIGPLPMLERNLPENELKPLRPSLYKEDTNCLEWLNKKEPNSVVYVSHGCVTIMTQQNLKEFAWGLANSRYPFLWIVRPDVVLGDLAIFPEEFLEEIKHRGFLTSWCPQDQVLLHPAIGVFLTHCGWNSLLESVFAGVPVICWPFIAEQQTNCRYACTSWGIGLEVNEDVKSNEIETLIKEIMESDKRKQLKQKVLDWKRKAKEATDVGGSSYDNFDRFIKDVLHHDY